LGAPPRGAVIKQLGYKVNRLLVAN